MNALRTIFMFQRRVRDASGRLAQPIINSIRLMRPLNESVGADAVDGGSTDVVQTGGVMASPVRPSCCSDAGPVIAPSLVKVPFGAMVARLLHVSNVGGILLSIAQICPVASNPGLIACTAPSVPPYAPTRVVAPVDVLTA